MGLLIDRDYALWKWREELQRRSVRLVNTPAEPLDDEACVQAALDFANDASLILISRSDGPPPDIRAVARHGEPRTWAQKLALSVGQFLYEDENLREKVRSVLKLLAAAKYQATGRRRKRMPVRSDIKGAMSQELKTALSDPVWQCDVQERAVIVRKPHGAFAVARFVELRDHRAVVVRGVLLAAESGREFARKIGWCKLSSCEKFYLAQQNPRGGPGNRTYCTKKHRKRYHDSSERKARHK